ncbi:MAG TPA: YebC/PmpR family DNA-binding transcriptional regulator [Candidatus Paceibacterota bacterium]|nr:YebC/PmpR family DNA-binding transcriptional regulator [Candidatus Paceibacterota bacterium]
MSGHNKWSKIKHKKAASDAKKGKIFSIHVRLITIESKKAKGDKNAPGLRAVIERAKADNMPNDNIDRAVAKGAGTGAENFEEVLYEAYGPGGAAILIEGITDNPNRTTPEIRHLLSSHGGNLGTQGSAAWAFVRTNNEWQPTALVPLEEADQESLLKLLEAIDDHDDVKNIVTNADLGEE